VPALIIALVVLVLVAIGIVVRLLIAEMAKPAQGQAKTVRKTVPAAGYPSRAAAPVAVGAGAVAVGASRTAVAGAGGAVATAAPGGGVAVLDAPKTTRTRKARMRDVVERGEGVRISPWRRMRSGVSLVVLVALLGMAAAAVVGGVVLLIALALEQAIN
jgi:hypothetical protein